MSSPRIVRKELTFEFPFKFGSDDEVFPAGSYEVETTEDPHETNGRTVYVRSGTVLIVRTIGKTRYCPIDSKDLLHAIFEDKIHAGAQIPQD